MSQELLRNPQDPQTPILLHHPVQDSNPPGQNRGLFILVYFHAYT